MKELLDIRVLESWASRKLKDFGQPMPDPSGLALSPFVRRIVVDTADPAVDIIRQRILQQEASTGELSTVLVSREYEPEELQNARFLQLRFECLAETHALECGTVFDCDDACPKCGAGRAQKSALILKSKTIPKGVDMAVTLTADEWIVSDKFLRLLELEGIGDCNLPAVDMKGKAGDKVWFQLLPKAVAKVAQPPTRFGVDYFHDDLTGKYTCPLHGLAGLNLLSELFVSRESVDGHDILIADKRIGRFSGWQVPSALLIISQRFARLLKKWDIKGYKLEVVHEL